MAKPAIPVMENPWGVTRYVHGGLPTACDHDNIGTRPGAPFKTIAAAVKYASPHETIIVAPEHVEVVAGDWLIEKPVIIIGKGVGSCRPKIVFANPEARIVIGTGGMEVGNVVVDCGGIDANYRVERLTPGGDMTSFQSNLWWDMKNYPNMPQTGVTTAEAAKEESANPENVVDTAEPKGDSDS